MSNVAKQFIGTRRHAKDSQKNRRVPSLRFHKASGQNYVVLSGKAIYCDRPDDPATEARYHEAIAEWMTAGRQLQADPDTLTAKELIARFWAHAEQYYRHLIDGRPKELEQFQLALRPLRELFATPAMSLMQAYGVRSARLMDGLAFPDRLLRKYSTVSPNARALSNVR